MSDLFGNDNEIIRTIGLYQPFASLMLWDKVETRWVRNDRKPPFPIGKYLIYSTKSPCTERQVLDWSGDYIRRTINDTLKREETKNLNGYAICLGDLVSMNRMHPSEKNTFVRYASPQIRIDKNGKKHTYIQWCLYFENIQRIATFEFKFGKQGVGHLPWQVKEKINPINS